MIDREMKMRTRYPNLQTFVNLGELSSWAVVGTGVLLCFIVLFFTPDWQVLGRLLVVGVILGVVFLAWNGIRASCELLLAIARIEINTEFSALNRDAILETNGQLRTIADLDRDAVNKPDERKRKSAPPKSANGDVQASIDRLIAAGFEVLREGDDRWTITNKLGVSHHNRSTKQLTAFADEQTV